MNYIVHLNKTFAVFCEDERLTPFHVSLYFCLFQYWNMAKFRNPISISRDELMRASKIGSVNTYIRSIKDLHSWNYLKYIPSYNPQKGSQVYMYTFDNSSNNGNDKSINNGSDISLDNSDKKATGKANEKPVIPSINSSNNTNKQNKKNKHGDTRKKSPSKSDQSVTRLFKSESGSAGKEKSSAKKEKPRQSRPLLLAVREHFITNAWPEPEAQKFFAHYQSNGWMVGKVPMQDWKASAEKWMLNNRQFTNGKEKLNAGKLNASTGKDYSEPL